MYIDINFCQNWESQIFLPKEHIKMSNNTTSNGISLKKILEMFFIPLKPLIDMAKDSINVQVGLIIFSIIIYIIPVIFYIATKNVFFALLPWLFIVWVCIKIGNEIAKSKNPSE